MWSVCHQVSQKYYSVYAAYCGDPKYIIFIAKLTKINEI